MDVFQPPEPQAHAPSYALNVPFTIKDVLHSINQRMESIHVHHLQDYDLADLRVPETPTQSLNALGFNSKRRKLRNKVEKIQRVTRECFQIQTEIR